jgi:hypothetical protein
LLIVRLRLLRTRGGEEGEGGERQREFEAHVLTPKISVTNVSAVASRAVARVGSSQMVFNPRLET